MQVKYSTNKKIATVQRNQIDFFKRVAKRFDAIKHETAYQLIDIGYRLNYGAISEDLFTISLLVPAETQTIILSESYPIKTLDLPKLLWTLAVTRYDSFLSLHHTSCCVVGTDNLLHRNPFPNISSLSCSVCIDSFFYGVDISNPATDQDVEDFVQGMLSINDQYWHSGYNDDMKTCCSKMTQWAQSQGGDYNNPGSVDMFQNLLNKGSGIDWDSLPTDFSEYTILPVTQPVRKKSARKIVSFLHNLYE